MDAVTNLHNAVGADLLRVELLKNRPRPRWNERYEVQAILGRGATGLVVSAKDTHLDRDIALKVRPVEGDSEALEEGRSLAKFRHPNIVGVHDIEIIRERINTREHVLWVLSMERLSGKTMRSWMRESPRSQREILHVLIEAGKGLEEAHKKNLIHRDVKPENIFVLEEESEHGEHRSRPLSAGPLKVKVIDFGFAKPVTSSRFELDRTQRPAGTSAYMAPEARMGELTRKSDQYALGVTLVEALTDRAEPAERRSPRGVSPEIWKVARRATANLPKDRFQSMGELVKALEAAASASAPRRRASLFLWLSLVAVVVLAVASRSQQTVDWGALVMPLPTPAAPGPGPAGNGRPGQAPRRVPAAEAAPEDDEHSTMESDGGSPGEISLREPWLPARDADPRQAEPARATPTPPSSDAPLRPAAPTTPARRCATPTPGETTFLTRRTEGGTPGSASVGRYALGLEVRSGTIRAVSLRRIQPARDQLEVRHFEVADCVLHVVAASEARIYTFDLNIDRRNVTGRFAATGDRQRGNFSGDVLPVANP